MPIGTITKMFGISAESLRIWEKNKIIPTCMRTPGGHRRYNQSHVDAISKFLGPPVIKVITKS